MSMTRTPSLVMVLWYIPVDYGCITVVREGAGDGIKVGFCWEPDVPLRVGFG